MYKIGIIGGGNMGEAIINGVRHKFSIFVSEKDKVRSDYLHSLYSQYNINVLDLESLISSSDILIVAVKPQDIDEVLQKIAKSIHASTLVISIAAGITISYIEKILVKKIKVIRTMPNLPAMIAEGMTAVCAGTYAKEADLQVAREIFDKVGKTVVIEENLMDAVTAVSGSGPAYVFFFLECLLKASQGLGLKSDLSKELVMATFLGSIHLLEKQKIEPGILRQKVTSKGGTTAAALEVFNKNNFEGIITQALAAAKKRAKELAK